MSKLEPFAKRLEESGAPRDNRQNENPRSNKEVFACTTSRATIQTAPCTTSRATKQIMSPCTTSCHTSILSDRTSW